MNFDKKMKTTKLEELEKEAGNALSVDGARESRDTKYTEIEEIIIQAGQRERAITVEDCKREVKGTMEFHHLPSHIYFEIENELDKIKEKDSITGGSEKKSKRLERIYRELLSAQDVVAIMMWTEEAITHRKLGGLNGVGHRIMVHLETAKTLLNDL